MTKLKIYPEIGRKPVGIYDTETRIFRKAIKGSLHIYNSPPSFCNDLSILHKLNSLGCLVVEIYNKENKKHYFASMKLIWEKSFVIPNYGYGSQRALELRYWTPEPPPKQETFIEK